MKKPSAPLKPALVQVGNHWIRSEQISQITEVKPGLYAVKFKDDPNPKYGTWVKGTDIQILLDYFVVLGE